MAESSDGAELAAADQAIGQEQADALLSTPPLVPATETANSWRVRLGRLHESFLELREPRLAMAITVEPPSDTIHSPNTANGWLSQRGYSQHLDCCPIRPPLDVKGWPGAIDIAVDGEPVEGGSLEGSAAWRVWLRFREDAEEASKAFNDAPALLRSRHGSEANADADGWLALLFLHGWSKGAGIRLSCDTGLPWRNGSNEAWFSCVTNLAKASVELIDQLLASDNPDPEPTSIPREAHEILPAIESFRARCQSPDGDRIFLTSVAADRIAELWVDMHLLGWQPPPEPDLSLLRGSAAYVAMLKGTPTERRKLWDRFDNALKIAERTARARLGDSIRAAEKQPSQPAANKTPTSEKPPNRRQRPGPKADDDTDAKCHAVVAAYRKHCKPKRPIRNDFWDWYIESQHDLGDRVKDTDEFYRRAKNYADRSKRGVVVEVAAEIPMNG